MMPPDKLLHDVVDSGRAILGWCADRDYSAYESDRQFRRAVEREFEIIGEALIGGMIVLGAVTLRAVFSVRRPVPLAAS